MRLSDLFKWVGQAAVFLSVVLMLLAFEVAGWDSGLAFRMFGLAHGLFVAFLVAGGMYLLVRGLETKWWRE